MVCLCFSGSPVNVLVSLEREDELVGSVVAPFFPQVRRERERERGRERERERERGSCCHILLVRREGVNGERGIKSSTISLERENGS